MSRFLTLTDRALATLAFYPDATTYELARMLDALPARVFAGLSSFRWRHPALLTTTGYGQRHSRWTLTEAGQAHVIATREAFESAPERVEKRGITTFADRGRWSAGELALSELAERPGQTIDELAARIRRPAVNIYQALRQRRTNSPAYAVPDGSVHTIARWHLTPEGIAHVAEVRALIRTVRTTKESP